MNVITPTIGRKVWYYPNGEAPGLMEAVDKSPMDATVVYVWSNGTVNLVVNDHYGRHWAFESVMLRQHDQPAPTQEHYCEWMPFQVGQAKAVADVGKVGAGPT